jgi:hypothetical protein
MNHSQVPLGDAVPRLVLPPLHPEKRLWKWTRLGAAVEQFGLRLFGRYLVIEVPGSARGPSLSRYTDKVGSVMLQRRKAIHDPVARLPVIHLSH